MTRYASEPHRRHVAGVTWTRDDLGRYRCKEGEKEFIAFPVRSGRSGPVSWTLYINGDRASDSWPMRPLDRALGEASKLVRKERFANDPSMQHPDMSYPMLEKAARLTLSSIDAGWSNGGEKMLEAAALRAALALPAEVSGEARERALVRAANHEYDDASVTSVIAAVDRTHPRPPREVSERSEAEVRVLSAARAYGEAYDAARAACSATEAIGWDHASPDWPRLRAAYDAASVAQEAARVSLRDASTALAASTRSLPGTSAFVARESDLAEQLDAVTRERDEALTVLVGDAGTWSHDTIRAGGVETIRAYGKAHSELMAEEAAANDAALVAARALTHSQAMRVAEAVRDAFVKAAEKRSLECSDRADNARQAGASPYVHEQECFARNQEAAYMKIAALSTLVSTILAPSEVEAAERALMLAAESLEISGPDPWHLRELTAAMTALRSARAKAGVR